MGGGESFFNNWTHKKRHKQNGKEHNYAHASKRTHTHTKNAKKQTKIVQSRSCVLIKLEPEMTISDCFNVDIWANG